MAVKQTSIKAEIKNNTKLNLEFFMWSLNAENSSEQLSFENKDFANLDENLKACEESKSKPIEEIKIPGSIIST